MSTRDFIRAKAKPAVDEAMSFAMSVMLEKGVYTKPKSPQDALAQLNEQAVDTSEMMAIHKLEYALED